MRYLVTLSILVSALWSVESMAVDLSMKFNVKTFGQSGSLEKSVVWNPETQEAMVRMGLVPAFIDQSLQDKVVSFSTAKTVEIVPLDNPELGQGCEVVSQWQFEYRPGLPDYLMYLTLKGPNCQRLAEVMELYHTRLRFVGLSATTQASSIDVAVEIGR